MGYRRTLSTRWSRRDRLAVLVVAVTVAFLTGTALLVVAVGGQTTAIAAEYGSMGSAVHYDSVATARADAPPEAVVLPTATVSVDGHRTRVVGVPRGANVPQSLAKLGVVPPDGSEDATLGSLDATRSVELHGRDRTLSLTAHSRQGTALFSPNWYVTDASAVERLGSTGALVVQPTIASDETVVPSRGVPLRSALAFFLAGTRQALAILTLVAAGGAILVGVTVYSVTRMSVRDRLETIRVIRSTGATRRTVLGLFALRAGLLTATGLAIGYAIGVIVPKIAVDAAVTLGAPTSLAVRVTPTSATVLVPVFVGVLFVGCLAGAVAAWPAVRTNPADLTAAVAVTTRITASAENAHQQSSEPTASDRLATLRSVFEPTLLDRRALVPTAATLTAFVTFVVLVSSISGAVGPLLTSTDTTITKPGSPHPVASRVPTQYATALRDQGVDASPEILLFEMSDGTPFVARGVNYSAFAAVSDASIERGRRPNSSDEVVVGNDLADALDLAVGDTLTLGGSTQPAVTRVTVVGTFRAPGSFDDQLLVSLPTARLLTGIPSTRVQFVRVDRLPEGTASGGSHVGVVAVNAPTRVVANRPVAVRLVLRNYGGQTQNASYAVHYANETRRVELSVPGGRVRTRKVSFPAGAPGNRTVSVANRTQSVHVVPLSKLSIDGLPTRVPPRSHPLVRVTNAAGRPVAKATLTVGDRTVTTNRAGRARLPVSGSGSYRIRASRGNESTSTHLSVTPNATRTLTASLSVQPTHPTLMTRPTAKATVSNPWNRSLTRAIRIEGPGGPVTKHVALDPGERTTVHTKLARRQPGEQVVTVRSRGTRLAAANYTVSGDPRIASALASGGYRGTTGIGRAVAAAFGNLWIVFGALLALATLMTVGGTTAAFAQAVHARRRTLGIYRTTGSPPVRILRHVVVDALRLGVVATVAAFVVSFALLRVLATMGYLTLFGVRLPIDPGPTLVLGLAFAGLGLTVFGAALATIRLITCPPSTLLSDDVATPFGTEGGSTDD